MATYLLTNFQLPLLNVTTTFVSDNKLSPISHLQELSSSVSLRLIAEITLNHQQCKRQNQTTQSQLSDIGHKNLCHHIFFIIKLIYKQPIKNIKTSEIQMKKY